MFGTVIKRGDQLATYTAKCIPSMDACSYNGTIYFEEDLRIGRKSSSGTGYYKIFIKGSNTALDAYKKKAIKGIYFFRQFQSNSSPPTKIGIELIKLSSTFDTSITKESQMPGGTSVVSVDADYDGNKAQKTPINGILENMSPLEIYNQIPIGFKIQTPYRGDDIPDKAQMCYSIEGAPSESQKPGLVFEFEDFTPTVTEQTPSGGAYIKPAAENVFTVAFDPFWIITAPTITKASFEFKDKATSVVTTKIINMSYGLDGRTTVEIAVPANTVANGKDYQWRVKFTLDDGGTGEFSPWADFTTKDTVPHVPRILEPQSAYLDGEQPITFKWEHNIDSGSAQHAYDLDYRQGGDWKSLVNHAVTPQQAYTAPGGTFGAGQLIWRVRTYNTDNIAGEYGTSDPSVVSAPPKPPAVTDITSVPRATVRWSSVDQQAYQLIVKMQRKIIEDSGAVFGIEKERRISSCLPDGTYTFSLRIQNGQGEWSAYTSSQVQITNHSTGSEQITAEPITGAVRITVGILAEGQPAASGTRYILRDGVQIAKISGNSYEDYLSVGTHTYTLRVIADDGNYYDSNTVNAEPKIGYAFIAKLNSPKDLVCLKYNGESPPSPQKQVSKNMVEHVFAGRELPIYDILIGRTVTWNCQYSFVASQSQIYDDVERMAFDGDTVILRDSRGNRCIGVIRNIKKSGRLVINTEFDITETNVMEGIPYD